MSTVIATIALIVIVSLAVGYIIKEKRRGVKCIGCPMAGECDKKREEFRKMKAKEQEKANQQQTCA